MCKTLADVQTVLSSGGLQIELAVFDYHYLITYVEQRFSTLVSNVRMYLPSVKCLLEIRDITKAHDTRDDHRKASNYRIYTY